MQLKEITTEVLETAYTYESYRLLLDQLMAEHKTTGSNQEDWLIDYAKLNIARMRKWEKKLDIMPAIKADIEKITEPQIWLTITEGWCGDAAQIVPVIEKLAALNSNIEHKIILRDNNTTIIDHFLTNGGRAIPMTLVLDKKTLNVMANWGPRPSGAQNIMNQLKTNPELKKEDLMEALHTWYAKDQSAQVQAEFTAALMVVV
jgi:Thioredoxin